MDSKQRESVPTLGQDASAVAAPLQPAAHLPPKGACWYCDKAARCGAAFLLQELWRGVCGRDAI